MEESMMDSGKMANNTAEVNLYQKMAKRDLVNGRMEERSSGLIEYEKIRWQYTLIDILTTYNKDFV